MRERNSEPQEVVRIEHGLTFTDIPEPGTCSSCESPLQKEFLEWREEADWLLVMATPVPGYGCTGCGLKEHEPSIGLNLMSAAADKFKTAGLNNKAQQILEQAERIRRILELRPAAIDNPESR